MKKIIRYMKTRKTWNITASRNSTRNYQKFMKLVDKNLEIAIVNFKNTLKDVKEIMNIIKKEKKDMRKNQMECL